MNGKLLRYRIHSASSQASSGMVHALQQSQGGWESARSCPYPQQLTIQTFLPVMTTSMTLVFHQYKIPTAIEVFVRAIKSQKYRKLGIVRPSDNEQTGFEERQSKTLYFQFACSYVKLAFRQPYDNQYNIFRQVAIDEIQLTGQLLSPQQLIQYPAGELQSEDSEEEMPERATMRNVAPTPRNNQEDRKIVMEEFKIVYDQLERRKREAAENEDFQEAAILKQLLLKFKQMDQRLNQLENQKKIAAEHEDFQKCSQLKTQITHLKQTIQIEVNNVMTGSQNNIHSASMLSQYESTPQQNVNLTQLTAIPVRYNDYQSNMPTDRLNSHQNQIVPALLSKVINKNLNLIGQTAVAQPLEEYPVEKQPKLIKLDSLDNMMLLRIQHHFRVIKEEIWKAMLMKNWKVKESAFNELVNLQIKTKQEMLACYELCSYSISDKHPNILIHTLLMLNRIVKSQANTKGRNCPAPQNYITQTILTTLIGLFVDTNPKVRELAIATYSQMPQICFISTSMVVNLMIKWPKATKGKTNPKILLVKLNVMLKFSQKYAFSEDTLHEILNWAVECLEDSNQEVRGIATQLIISGIMPHVGEEIVRQKVKNIRSNILGSFMMALNSSIQIDNTEHSQFNHVYKADKNNSLVEYQQYSVRPEEKLETQNRQMAEIPEIKVLELEAKQSAEDDYRRDLCDYCGEQLDGDDLDQAFQKHVTYQCQAIQDCQECHSKVYIREMTDHLLKECQNAKFQQCRKCRLAFSFDDIYEHEAQNVCKPLPRGMQRCQYCAQNVQPNDSAWLAHARACQYK